jgi:anthraniloyl-CoA monooxygenase
MEDAVTLAEELATYASGAKSLGEALGGYQQQREVPVGKIQTAARPSLSWWENFGTYQQALDPLTFAFHFFSRSIGIDRIAQRDPDLVRDVREAWCRRHGQSALASPVDLVTDSGAVRTGRRLVIRSSTADQASLEDRDGRVVTVPAVQVPDAGVDITKVARQLPVSGTVAVVGPASLARTLLAEEARLRRGLLTIIADTEDVDDVTVETALLAGRADAVAGPAVLATTGEVR